MPEHARSRAFLPHHLRPNMIASLSPDEPCIINQKDLSVAFDHRNGDLFIDDDLEIDMKDREIRKGRVAVMLTMGEDGQMGYVVDLRHTTPTKNFGQAYSEEKPDDTEDLSWWIEGKKHEKLVSACVYRESQSGNNETNGDSNFFAAALHLAELVDQIAETQKAKAAKEAKKRKVADKSKTSRH